jgi:FKBP12-rapamycin complex-associated protein
VLNEFVRTCALPYLEDDSMEVRQAAALTCCRLLSKDPICYQTSAHSIKVMSEVLEKLLMVAIADPEARIRETVLRELSDKFDRHLAQAENVRTLFIALNDAVFSNRELVIGIIGRLALHNPAYVMPSLRKVLIQMISNLQFSTRM